MKKVVVKEKEFEVAEGWNDLNLFQYEKLVKLFEGDKEVEELFLFEFIKIISGLDDKFLMSCFEQDLEVFLPMIQNYDMKEFAKEKPEFFMLNDTLYSWVSPSQLTMGEKISIKLLEKESKDMFETTLNLLSVLIRPAKEEKDEFGKSRYVCEPFDADIEILKQRKELIKQIKASQAMWVLEAFTLGRE